MLTYALEKNGSSSLYTQLYGCIRRDILSGALPPRQKLPSKRALAQHLEVSVITLKRGKKCHSQMGWRVPCPRRLRRPWCRSALRSRCFWTWPPGLWTGRIFPSPYGPG